MNSFSVKFESLQYSVSQFSFVTTVPRKMVPIKKRARSFPIFFILPSPPFFHFCFLVFYQRTIAGVDLLEMTWKDGILVLCPHYGQPPVL